MKPQKSENGKQLVYRLISRTCTPLIFLSFILTSTKTYSLVPDFAKVIQIQGQGVTINSQTAQLGNILSKYKDYLAVPAPYGNEWIFADLDLVKSGVGNLGIRAKAKNNSTTYYYIPCTVNQPQYTESEITWSNGKKSACGEGMRVTNNSGRRSNLPKSQTKQIAQVKNLDKTPLFLNAQNPPQISLRYYCSSVPDSGRGEDHITAGLTSIEEACQQSQETCKTNNGSECSIATMGEWNLYDPNLVMSVTCADGKSSSQKVSGAEISTPGISNDALIQKLLKQLLGQFGEFLGGILGIKPQACYLEVYHPDEILISPVNTQQTRVVTTGLESGIIQVDITEGQVKLRSTKETEGITASQGTTYLFTSEGSISQGRGETVENGSNIPPSSNTTPQYPDGTLNNDLLRNIDNIRVLPTPIPTPQPPR